MVASATALFPTSVFKVNAKKNVDFINEMGEKCKKVGMKFCFHNHYTEFEKVDYQIPYDVLMINTDPKLVTFEMDLCWTSFAGVNPVDYFNKYPGRFELLRMKDLTSGRKVATIGEATINFKPIFAKLKKAGVKYFVVEHNVCVTHTPLESARISRELLIKNL